MGAEEKVRSTKTMRGKETCRWQKVLLLVETSFLWRVQCPTDN